MVLNNNTPGIDPDGLNSDPDKKGLQVIVDRPAVNDEEFNKNYGYTHQPQTTIAEDIKSCLVYEFSRKRLLRGLRARLPVVDVVRTYNVKEYAIGDTVSGITVGVMQIPLGMAYAQIAGVDPIYGLYSSFFPVLFYFIFGTSRHISQGTFAVISLMCANAVATYSCHTTSGTNSTSPVSFNSTSGDLSTSTMSTTTLGQDIHHDQHPTCYTPIQVASALALLVGVLQVIFGFVRVGALSVYLSDALVSGFTTGAAVLVFTTQFATLFGIKAGSFKWPGEIIKTYIDVFSKMPTQINVPTVVVSIICIVVLAVTSEYINPWITKKIPVPIPIELIAVIVGTGVSYAMDFSSTYKIKIVGSIPSGMPSPQAPPVFGLLGNIFGDAIAIAGVSYVLDLSLCKIFAKKHSYDINANQEFIAMGLSNFISSFFRCFPMSVALSRTMVNDQVGGKTQVFGLISSVVVLVVILVIAPLFKTLPNCVLAAIIVVAIRKMFLQYRDMVRAWSISRFEAMTWLVTTLAVSFVAIDVGLAIGVVFSIVTIVLRTQLPYTTMLGHVRNTTLYKDLKTYAAAMEISGVKLYHFSAPLVFANNKTFRKEMYRLTEINPRKVLKKLEKLRKKESKAKAKNETSMGDSRVSMYSSDNELEGDRTQQGVSNLGYQSTEDLNQTNLMHKTIDHSVSNVTAYRSIAPLQPHGHKHLGHSASEAPGFSNNDSLQINTHHIIIDCSAISFIDSMGVTTLLQVIDEYKKVEITVFLAACPDPVLEVLLAAGFHEKAPQDTMYPSVHDAVVYATRGHDIEGFVTSDQPAIVHPSRQ